MIKGVEWQKTRKNARKKVGGSVNRRERDKYLDLWTSGLNEGDIAKKFNRDIRTVQKYLGDTIKSEMRAILAPCLTNPHLEQPDTAGRGPLELNQQNWRLDPITWFYLCAPDLTEEGQAYWRTEFAEFRNKMEKITFWQHYQNLRDKVNDLQNEYEKATNKLSGGQREVWERIQRERKGCFPPSRTAENPNEDWKDWLHIDDYDSIEEVVSKLRHLIPDLDERLVELEELLQKLNDDLSEKHTQNR